MTIPSQPTWTIDPLDHQDFSRYRRCVAQLLEHIPPIADVLARYGDTLPLDGWDSMCVRFQSFEQQAAEPVMIATLYGPSGAGKSAWFRQLTGIEVPSGDTVRPMTHACAMAVPEGLARVPRLRQLFPGFDVQPLEELDEVRRAGADDQRLLYIPYAPAAATQPLPLILVDVPDFNTVEQANWAKAERVLDRAEVVVFVVFGDGYKDDRVVGELARCCRKAGFLAFVFTKTTPEAAVAKWRDLLASVVHFDAFQQRRNDGRTLPEFLADCHAYSSPLSERPQLADIRPLDPGSPTLDSLLRGQDAVRIVLSGLLESTSQAVASCRRILARAEERRAELVGARTNVRKEVQLASQTIAASQFPAGRLIELAVDVSRQNLHWSARLLRYPVTLLARQGRAASRQLMGWVFEDPEADEIKQRETLEQERLHEFVARLIDRFRSLYPEQAKPGGMLDHQSCAEAREGFRQQALPVPAEGWEDVVRQALERWCRNHRGLSHLLVVSADVMLAAGATAIVVDLGTTGGMIGTVGLPALAGAGGVAAGRVLGQFGGLQLKKVAEEAYEEWRKQRERELADHLQQHFADPLFAKWFQCLEQLQPDSLTQCRVACDQLSSLARRLGVKP